MLESVDFIEVLGMDALKNRVRFLPSSYRKETIVKFQNNRKKR